MPLDYTTLNKILHDEKNSKSLSPVEPNFYAELQHLLARMRETITAGEDAKSVLLRDQYRKSQHLVKEILNLRTRKITLLALAKASGTNPSPEPMTPEDQTLLNQLMQTIADWRARIGLEKKSAEIAVREIEMRSTETAVPAQSLQPAFEHATQEKLSAFEDKPFVHKHNNKLIYVLTNIPPFAMEDKNYHLGKEDIAYLPHDIADILVMHGKAKEIKP